jgi:hypothetical protein
MIRRVSVIPQMLGAGLLVVACGGDSGDGDGSNSNSQGTTDAVTVSSSSTGSVNPTTGATADTIGDSEAQTSTADPGTSTGDSTGGTTDASTSTGMVDPSTTTTGDTSSTSGVDTTTGGSTGGDTTGGNMETCPLAMMHAPCDAMSDDALHAMGLNCTSLGGKWADKSLATAVTKLDFQAPPEVGGLRSWRVAKSYGSYIDPMTKKPFWSAKEGDKMLMISSGGMPAPDGQGVITIADGDVYNDSGIGGQWDSDVMPPPMSPQKGSADPMGFKNCDGKNDCSNTIFDQWNLGGGDAEDKMWFSFKLLAPALANGDIADANGYSFDFAYFSAEFPEYVDTNYNDIFAVWQSSEDYTGNVTFINGQPMTVTALWPIDFQGECDFLDPNCLGADEHLQGTGYIADGGATGWYTATGGVKPGETFGLAFAIFDMGDSTFDTTALIDNWQWDCKGCIPNEVDSCGVIPQ